MQPLSSCFSYLFPCMYCIKEKEEEETHLLSPPPLELPSFLIEKTTLPRFQEFLPILQLLPQEEQESLFDDFYAVFIHYPEPFQWEPKAILESLSERERAPLLKSSLLLFRHFPQIQRKMQILFTLQKIPLEERALVIDFFLSFSFTSPIANDSLLSSFLQTIRLFPLSQRDQPLQHLLSSLFTNPDDRYQGLLIKEALDQAKQPGRKELLYLLYSHLTFLAQEEKKAAFIRILSKLSLEHRSNLAPSICTLIQNMTSYDLEQAMTLIEETPPLKRIEILQISDQFIWNHPNHNRLALLKAAQSYLNKQPSPLLKEDCAIEF